MIQRDREKISSKQVQTTQNLVTLDNVIEAKRSVVILHKVLYQSARLFLILESERYDVGASKILLFENFATARHIGSSKTHLPNKNLKMTFCVAVCI